MITHFLHNLYFIFKYFILISLAIINEYMYIL